MNLGILERQGRRGQAKGRNGEDVLMSGGVGGAWKSIFDVQYIL